MIIIFIGMTLECLTELERLPASMMPSIKNYRNQRKKFLIISKKFLYNEEYINLGHNILGFDIYIHNIFRKLLGRPTDYSYLKQSIDTLSIAKAIHKDIEYDKEIDFLSWQFKLNSVYERGMRLNLGACCKTYDVEFDPEKLHDALYDIQKNYEVFKKMMWTIKI